ncbi:MAG: ABC transporter substrate-binding protein [Pseudomonadota bacterium]
MMLKRALRRVIAPLLFATIGVVPVAAKDATVRIAVPFGFNDPNPDPAIGWNGWRTSDTGVTETLFWLNTDGDLSPKLAKSAKSLSPTEWEIHLREGITFHDGTPLDAEAVRFSLMRVVSPDSAVFNERIASLIGIADVTVVDPMTVRIKTQVPNAAFLNDLVDPGLSIISSASNAEEFFGTGPFTLEEIVPGEKIVTARFDDYWGGAAAAPGIELLTLKDPATVMLALEAGDIDIAANFPDSDLPRVSSRDDLTVDAVADGRLMFFYMQTEKGALADSRVRHALDHLLPRDQIVGTVLHGRGGTPGVGLFPAGKAWTNPELSMTAYDHDRALALLAEAGITDTNGDGRLEKDGEPFRVVIRSYEGRPSMRPAAELYQAHMEAAGIATELQILRDWTVAVDDFREGRADLLMFSSNATPTGNPAYLPNMTLRTDALENYGGWSNAEFDDLLRQAIVAFDPQERTRILNRMQAIVVEELPIVTAFFKNRVVVARSNVNDFKMNPAGVYLVDNRLHVDR